MICRSGWLAAFCVVAVVCVSGCGGGTKTVTTTVPASSATGSTGATGPTTAAATTPTTTTTPASASARLKAAEAANPAIARQIAQAIATCKSSVNAAPTLTAGDKAKLAAICDKAGSGDTAAVQQATAQVCGQIIRDSVPVSAQAQALASCPKP